MPIIFDIEEGFSLVYPSMYIIFKVAENIYKVASFEPTRVVKKEG